MPLLPLNGFSVSLPNLLANISAYTFVVGRNLIPGIIETKLAEVNRQFTRFAHIVCVRLKRRTLLVPVQLRESKRSRS